MIKLEEIIAAREKDVNLRRSLKPLEDIVAAASKRGKALSLKNLLAKGAGSGIIAEFKPASPSRGVINAEADVEKVTADYVKMGASALSVLTENRFFGGSFQNLEKARRKNDCPILQKDFIIDHYQIAEARSYGADVILLIAAVLNREKVKSLAQTAHSYGLEVILEVHKEEELVMLTEDVDIVGVNNRDLFTFKTNIDTSVSMVDMIPDSFVKISESGINDAETIMLLREAGFSGFLIGEHFMQHKDPAKALGQLVGDMKKK
ncbi:MAG TPA: indole-3-glycerol phosphate synthase TrpC [Bacteroidales bacterium]|nr:indole-3-glycerol phosphate synthase TrpC [Bacteroidales bacterium]